MWITQRSEEGRWKVYAERFLKKTGRGTGTAEKYPRGDVNVLALGSIKSARKGGIVVSFLLPPRHQGKLTGRVKGKRERSPLD